MDWLAGAFGSRGVDAPRLCAEMLLGHVVGLDRMRLYLDVDRPASQDELTRLRALAARALKDEPVQYLVGEAHFFGLALRVDRRVLIPRPCTETIVESLLQGLRGAGVARGAVMLIADVCTGSGAIGVALAKNLPGATVHATDISPDALEVARANVERHKVGARVHLHEGDLLGALPAELAGHLDALVSNPPYIPDHEWEAVAPTVRQHEPTLALRGGADGLDLVRPLIHQAPAWLKPGGRLLVEIAACTADEAVAIAAGAGLLGARVEHDLEGHRRVLVATRGS